MTAVGNGSAQVTASVGSVSARATVTVLQVATTLTITRSVDTLTALGDSVQLTASLRDAMNNAIPNATVLWSSSNPAVATVSSAGIVIAVANGTAEVSATGGELSAAIQISVLQRATTLRIAPFSDTLTSLGQSEQLSAIATDSRNNPVAIVSSTWNSSNNSVVSVLANGRITAVGNGTALLSVQATGTSATAAIAVSQRIASIRLTPATSTLVSLGEALPLLPLADDARGNAVLNATFSWTSTNPSVASVNQSGVVTSVADGTARITASRGAVSGEATVNVMQGAVSVSVFPAADTLAFPGAAITLNGTLNDALGRPIAYAPSALTWRSDKVSVATVTASGLVTAVGQGVARITISAGALSAVAVVTVDDFGDLGIGWIHRSPEIDFVQGALDPTREGWPTVAQSITWDAQVKNWSLFARMNVSYRWTLNGAPIASGHVDLPSGTYVTVSLPRAWSFQRQRLKFELDPTNQVHEIEERNNSLEILTDALSVGFYVEQSVYDHFARHQHRLGVGANSWEDWAQRHIITWNSMFENARFAATPNGVLDRLRLDKITVLPDGSLPLAGGLPGNHPNLNDRTVDLQWGFPSSILTWAYKDFTTIPGPDGSPENFFHFEGSLMHELGHARYLIDLYGFNVSDGQWTPTGITGKGSNIAITEAGQLIVGTPYMPIQAWEHVHYTPMRGLMSRPYIFVDEFSAAALNRIAGHRARLGNANAPGNIGIFLNDLPLQNRLTVRDSLGQVLAGASVKVFQAGPKPGQWYGKYFDNTPDLQLTTDVEGRVLLGRNPFGSSGIVHTYGHSNGVVIIRIEHQGRVGYAFLESWRFNLEYWKGKSSLADYDLSVQLR